MLTMTREEHLAYITGQECYLQNGLPEIRATRYSENLRKLFHAGYRTERMDLLDATRR